MHFASVIFHLFLSYFQLFFFIRGALTWFSWNQSGSCWGGGAWGSNSLSFPSQGAVEVRDEQFRSEAEPIFMFCLLQKLLMVWFCSIIRAGNTWRQFQIPQLELCFGIQCMESGLLLNILLCIGQLPKQTCVPPCHSANGEEVCFRSICLFPINGPELEDDLQKVCKIVGKNS